MNKASLILEGALSIDETCSLVFQNDDVNDWLTSLFLRHFYPESTANPRAGFGGSFRVTFRPLSGQADSLILEGVLGVDEMSEFYFESPMVSDFLITIFLRHFYPENTPGEGPEPEDDCQTEAGLFHITFEPL